MSFLFPATDNEQQKESNCLILSIPSSPLSTARGLVKLLQLARCEGCSEHFHRHCSLVFIITIISSSSTIITITITTTTTTTTTNFSTAYITSISNISFVSSEFRD